MNELTATMKRIFAGFGILLLIGLVAFVATVVWSSLSARQRAERLLRDVRALDAPTATLEDVKRLAAKYPAREVFYAPGCTEQECQVSIAIHNAWLHRLHLAPETRFEAFFNLEERRLRYFNIGFVKSRPPYLPLHVRASEVIPRPGETYERTFMESCVGDPRGQWLKLATAHIRPSASAEEQEKAFTFNFDCLTRVGGCDDFDFMPRICTGQRRPPR